MKFILFFGLGLGLISCNKESKKEEVVKDDFQMYEISEMAALMERMYVENQNLKKRIETKDTLGSFPNYFLEIEKATFTKGKERDAFFNEHAQLFLNSQKEIYSSKETKNSFNAMVDQCIACHEVKCGGPIVRIKKLYIK